MRTYGLLDKSPEDFRPGIDAVIEHGGPELRAWWEATGQERYDAFVAYRDAPVDVEGGTLVQGQWYDVSVKTGYYATKVQTWRNCRYVGRTQSRGWREDKPSDYFTFERWGAKAATDQFARGSADTVSAANLSSVAAIEVAPALAEKAGDLARA